MRMVIVNSNSISSVLYFVMVTFMEEYVFFVMSQRIRLFNDAFPISSVFLCGMKECKLCVTNVEEYVMSYLLYAIVNNTAI